MVLRDFCFGLSLLRPPSSSLSLFWRETESFPQNVYLFLMLPPFHLRNIHHDCPQFLRRDTLVLHEPLNLAHVPPFSSSIFLCCSFSSVCWTNLHLHFSILPSMTSFLILNRNCSSFSFVSCQVTICLGASTGLTLNCLLELLGGRSKERRRRLNNLFHVFLLMPKSAEIS